MPRYGYISRESPGALAHRLMLFSNALRAEGFMGLKWKTYDPSSEFLNYILSNLEDAMRDRSVKDNLIELSSYASNNILGGQQDDLVFPYALAHQVCEIMSSQNSRHNGNGLRRLSYLLEIGGEQLIKHPFVRNAPAQYPTLFNETLPSQAFSGNHSAQIIMDNLGLRGYFNR